MCRSHLAAAAASLSTSAASARSASPEPSQQQQQQQRAPQQQRSRGGGSGPRDSSRQDQQQASPSQQQQQQQWHNLAMQNAPRKVFELIGDPRTGLADNVTTNPFGDITVDMLHHQLSNEVYWYKYEFAGNMATETHRNARLSEHAKNLIYILRAKDPFRWTVEALAKKFHVRQQRILAILTLKEMEAHSMESGRSLSGPLSAYACPVHMDDLHVDPKTQELLEGRAAVAGPLHFELEQQLPQLQQVTSQVQLQLLQALQPYGYSLEAMGDALAQQVAAIDRQLRLVLPLDTQPEAAAEEPADGEPAPGPAAAPSPVAAAAAHWSSVKRELQALLGCVARVLGVSETLAEESLLVSTAGAVKAALARPGAGAAGAAGAGDAEVKDASALVQGWEGAQLLRLVLALGLPQRKQLLDSVPRVSLELQSQGIDLLALTSTPGYLQGVVREQRSGPGKASASAAALSPLPLDVLGFRPVGDEVLGELVQRMRALERSVAALGELGGRPGPSSTKEQGPSEVGSAELQGLLDLRRSYLSTDSMIAGVYQRDNERGQAENKLPMLQVLQEADPTYPSRVQQYDAVMSVLQQGLNDVALMGLQELEGSEERAQAVLQAMQPKQSSTNGFLDPEKVLQPGESYQPQAQNQLHKDSWDLMAAFIDNRVAHKVYQRGSGERHIVRVPTYPAFEGYTLQEYDRMDESEISQLNRQVAQREEAELGARFRSNLFFNLGLVGTELWDNSKPQAELNPGSTLDKPLVVYDVSKSGETVYPPLKVVQPDGSERALNDQERVYQERRRTLRGIPYLFQRIRRKTEIQ